MMQKKPERIAWLVLWGAFAVFLTLCAAVPVSARSYLLYSTSAKQASLEVIQGTISVQDGTSVAPIAVTNASKVIQLSEGSSIETNETSKGILTFFDGSTLTLYTNTQVVLHSMRVAAFAWGRVPISMDVEQTRGRIRVGTAPLYAADGKPSHTRSFRVQTQHLVAMLGEGSYAIDVNLPTDSSQVTANAGTVDVIAQGRSVALSERQRTVVTRGNPPLLPLQAAQDLMVNGDLKDPPERGWNALPDPTTPGVVPGKAEAVAIGDRIAIHIIRANSASPAQTSAIAGWIQQINREVSDFRSLKVTADIRLENQSLAGGGVLGSEYPLILRLRYRDQYGSEGEWVHGFYYQNTLNNRTDNGELVAQSIWIPWESANLFELADPRPFYITSLQIYASGWDYESYISNIKLIVE